MKRTKKPIVRAVRKSEKECALLKEHIEAAYAFLERVSMVTGSYAILSRPDKQVLPFYLYHDLDGEYYLADKVKLLPSFLKRAVTLQGRKMILLKDAEEQCSSNTENV